MPRKTKPLEILPRRLRMAMSVRGMTSADLMRASKMGSSQISEYLNGHREPGATRVAILAQTLNVSADFLLGLTDKMEARKK